MKQTFSSCKIEEFFHAVKIKLTEVFNANKLILNIGNVDFFLKFCF